MNPDDHNVSAKIMSDIKLIRESFNRPISDTARSMSDMAQRIATGVYLVTQHLSDKVSLKNSLRTSADELLNVVYKTNSDSEQSDMYSVITVADKIMSFSSIARVAGAISDINSFLIEREVLKISRLASMMLVRGDSDGAHIMMRDRSDVRLKMLDLFDYSEVDARKAKQKMSDKIQKTDAVFNTPERPSTIGQTAQSKGHSAQSAAESFSMEAQVVSGGADASEPYLSQTADSVVPIKLTSSNIQATPQSQEEVIAEVSAADTSRFKSEDQSVLTQESRATSAVDEAQANGEVVPNNSEDPTYGFTPITQIPHYQPLKPAEKKPTDQSAVMPSFGPQRGQPLPGTQSSTEMRRQQILKFIRENGIVSIKEIAEGVTGVSDKTLQRALIDLVNDKVVVRHGDRRWSRYEAVI